jgi:hypothetical protein
MAALATPALIRAQPSPTADFSGVWMTEPRNMQSFSEITDISRSWSIAKYEDYLKKQGKPTTPVPLAPAAAEKYRYTRDPIGGKRNELDPYVNNCAPPGFPRFWLIGRPFEILQDSRRVLILYESDHWVRQIWTDGRGHPRDLKPTWGGHSIGTWEGDTLVVDTIGLTDKAPLDTENHPHSSALHVVERFDRPDREHLLVELTFEDPKAFTKPWKGMRISQLHPGWVLDDVVACEDRLLGTPIPVTYGFGETFSDSDKK